MAQPSETLGQRAAAMLVEAIGSGELPDSETLPVQLVVRESSTQESPAGVPG